MKKKLVIFALLVILGMPVMGSGSIKKETITSYKAPTPQQEYIRLMAEGDLNFNQLHLYGWLKADAHYARAYEIKQTEELKKKRFLTLALIAFRQKDERLADTETYRKIAQLGTFPKTGKLQYFPPILKHYHSTPIRGKNKIKPGGKKKQAVDISLFDVRKSGLDAYLYLYFLNYYTYDLPGTNTNKTALFKQHGLDALINKHNATLSPLFIHRSPKGFSHRADEIEKQRPDFCEFFAAEGNRLFREKRLKQAAVYYRKVLKLIPDYTAATNGLAGIYFFTVQDYEAALDYYNRTLSVDPLNPTALFGKAVSYHYLEQYRESNEALDFMLENQAQHHGQAYYYKACNKQKQGEPDTARQLVDKAKPLMPNTGEVLFLSGMLHFSAGNMKEAENDFVNTMLDQQFAKSYPLYYLGLISLKAGDWRFFDNFKDAIKCLSQQEGKMEERIAEVDKLHLGEKEKEWMRRDRRKKLEKFMESSKVAVNLMVTTMEQNRETRRKHDELLNNASIEKVKAALKKDPDYLNTRDKEDTAPLDRAIEKGLNGTVRFMVEKGAPLDTKNGIGYTSLHWAVILNQEEIVDTLVRAGAEVNVRAGNKHTPLYDSIWGSFNNKITRLLLAAGADPYTEVQGEIPPFTKRKRPTDICKLLTPIHTAAEKGEMQKVEAFLKKQPMLLDAKDEMLRTPLHAAVNAGRKAMAVMLIKRGAALEIRDRNGFSPLETARRKGYDDIEHLLRNNGACNTDKEVLTKNLPEKEAVMWRLDTHAWAVKTRNHFLVFDYDRYNFSVPKRKVLGNGFINPGQIKDQQVTVFVSHKFVEQEARVLRWKPHIPRINYVFGYRHVGGPGITCMKAGTTRRVGDLEIAAIPVDDDGMAFLVKVDGMTILFSNTRIARGDDAWKKYKEGVDYLAANGPVPDVAFLPLYTEERLQNGTLYALEKLTPAVMYPLTYNTDKIPLEAFAGKATAKGLKTKIHPISNNDNRYNL
ncbi:MAG: tetratricopeptide repeat protein [bacterium]|nr:tetratricopeptide repeat protein [bacterium]